ncbi:hypothetical protein B0J17DRAFT_702824 [Rhizoctonia solani]|nr:hypothetical protein B0J17DRAFT_702824 [Rhizoctonia solani]
MNPPFINNWKDPQDYFERFSVLRALSQICRLSRKMYLPLLWERFQVCLVTNPGDNGSVVLGKLWKGRARGCYKVHICGRTSVALTRFQTSNVLPPFVELLGVLPNLHTLEIPHAHSEMTKALKAAFEGNIFPSIQKVILPTCAHEILRCCPEIREVTCNEDDGGRLVSALVYNGCRKLEVLRGIYAGPILMKRLSVACPPLKCVSIPERSIPENVIPTYATFPSLCVIKVDCFEDIEADDYVKLAQDTLRACVQYKPKKKKRKSHRKLVDGNLSDSESTDLYSEPRMVSIRRFIKGPTYDKSLSQFSAVRIKQFPIEELN